ncbi:MAG: hypothetical protein AAGF51_11790 [Pseudomonadota bacterium]
MQLLVSDAELRLLLKMRVAAGFKKPTLPRNRVLKLRARPQPLGEDWRNLDVALLVTFSGQSRLTRQQRIMLGL